MPRRVDPGTIQTGSGQGSLGDADLIGPGMVGPGPNVGESNADDPIDALSSHLQSNAAHAAEDITVDPAPGLLSATNVEDALDELSGSLLQEPPKLGEFSRQRSLDPENLEPGSWGFSGIPDWGILKLADSNLTASNAPADVFPYYLEPPSPAKGSLDFQNDSLTGGADPQSDFFFNSGIAGSVEGAGAGLAHAGGFTRIPGGGTFGPVVQTTRILPRTNVIDGGTGFPEVQPVTLSGYVYPADRGVLALMHWPAGADVAEFLAQPLLDRCVAAILLGHGLSGASNCDGQAGGGLFCNGVDADGNYDPFAYPGRATGQYDLGEIHAGTNALDGSPLRAPWDDLNGDATPGNPRIENSNVPAAGQVRLGSDPAAGETPISFGIPILGGSVAAYSPAQTEVGNTVVSTQNFFAYRLPCLDDYSQSTGLKYTPRGVDGTATLETARYYTPKKPNADAGLLFFENAGGYDPFEKDYTTWQIARYRHTFTMPSTQALGDPEDVGSYVLVHFKREQDFESYVRDGILPDDVTNGYEVYGVSSLAPLDAPANRVNEQLTTVSPLGPAPDYGYRGVPYHAARVDVLLDNDGDVADLSGGTYTFAWASASAPLTEQVVRVSGVAYFLPRRQDTADPSFQVLSLDVNIPAGTPGFWEHTYRTDSRTLSGASVDSAPALLSSPNPAFVLFSGFSYDWDQDIFGTPSYSLTVGAPGAGLTASDFFLDRQRVEVPFTHMGSNANGFYTLANGPRPGDDVDIHLPVAQTLDFLGDQSNPAFTQDAKIRLYLRKPEGQGILPSGASGLGQEFTPTPAGAILFHSTGFSAFAAPTYPFGNFNVGGIPSAAYASLQTPEKDTRERFLDEVYRWRSDWQANIGLAAPYNPSTVAHLQGPGMQGWLGPIEVPVRAGVASAPWDTSSFVQQGLYANSIADGQPQDIELQVAGLPDRNPLTVDTAKDPFPSAGLLVYPQKDYTTGYRPGPADLASAQPDYSASTGVRSYVRSFDVGFAGTENVAGTNRVYLRIDGLRLEAFAYEAPGPGGLNGASGIAIYVKVPGLTTWMDVGRRDGTGPSKQDPLLDGAGCQVLSANTFGSQDPESDIPFAQVEINTGANLFEASGLLPGGEAGTVPLLVKVEMAPQASGYNLELEYAGSPGAFNPGPDPSLKAGGVRGIVGLRIVPNSQV